MTARHVYVNHLKRALTAYLVDILAESIETDDTGSAPPDYWGLLEDDF